MVILGAVDWIPGSLCILAAIVGSAHAQEPVIFPGGVLNAASYSTGGPAGRGIAPGSIAVIFGANLARETRFPDPLLVPTRLGGAMVMVGGIAAPLLYVSPTQIDFQMPVRVTGPTNLVVTTDTGSSRPYPIDAVEAFGVFSVGLGGCGPAAALNTAKDGTLSVNSRTSSIAPGDVLAIFGTGLYPLTWAPPDGVIAPSDPLGVYTGVPGTTMFDVDGPVSSNLFAGAASGLVGTNQLNLRVPENVREGCAVPILISAGESGNTKPVTVSIRKGGGECVDPPAASYGQIQWMKTIYSQAGGEQQTETVVVSLQESPGRRPPAARAFDKSGMVSSKVENFGGVCSVPGYRSLDAGAVTVQGPGVGPIEAAVAGLGPPESGQVAGLAEHLAILPRGTIQQGTFRVIAKGGADVGAFQSDLLIGAPIEITTPLPAGTTVRRASPLVMKWSGGDAQAWATLKLVVHHGTYDQIRFVQASVSAGSVAIGAEGMAGLPAGPVEVILEIEPERAETLMSSGLSLGGEHTWKYSYHFSGLSIE